MGSDNLITMAFDGIVPDIKTPITHAGIGAAVLGRVTIGPGAWLGRASAIRADGHDVRIGAGVFLGPNATVHIAHDLLATYIGDNVTIGAGAVAHACTVGTDCVIGDNAVILDGSHVGDATALARDSVVFPRSELLGGWLYAGNPAKPVREITKDELDALRSAARAQGEGGGNVPVDQGRNNIGAPLFVANTAALSGNIHCDAQSNIWFGCELNGGSGEGIRVGERSNVQDNARLICTDGALILEADVTIGHNAVLSECVIGERSLIGMGAIVSPGTRVEQDVLLAAGAKTEEGQTLSAGYLWAGSPARPKRQLEKKHLAVMGMTIPTYVGYAEQFDATQKAQDDT